MILSLAERTSHDQFPRTDASRPGVMSVSLLVARHNARAGSWRRLAPDAERTERRRRGQVLWGLQPQEPAPGLFDAVHVPRLPGSPVDPLLTRLRRQQLAFQAIEQDLLGFRRSLVDRQHLATAALVKEARDLDALVEADRHASAKGSRLALPEPTLARRLGGLDRGVRAHQDLLSQALVLLTQEAGGPREALQLSDRASLLEHRADAIRELAEMSDRMTSDPPRERP